MPVDLRVALGQLELANPVLVAAGTFGYGLEFPRSAHVDQLGGIITKTLTLVPRQGNPPPRLVETPSGMLNAVGLQNVGLDVFLNEKLPQFVQLQVPVIVSILGESPGEIETMCARLDAESGVAAIELNLSCPNLRNGAESNPQPRAPHSEFRTSLMVAQDPDETFVRVASARQRTTKPLIAKLSPDVTDIRPIAQAAERAGADALSLVNTFTGMSLDPQARRSRLGSLTGGLGGPAIRPLAVYRVWMVRQAVQCPIIGIGGIVKAEEAVEFFLAGATAVAIGTANFTRPDAAWSVVKGLRRYLKQEGLQTIRGLIGAFKPLG